MDGFQAGLLRRLPLAQAVLRGFGYALQPATLEGLFAGHRGRCYEDIFRFPHLVALIVDALTTHQGSGHRAFVAAACGTLPVAEQNAYGKLARIPEELSMALVLTFHADPDGERNDVPLVAPLVAQVQGLVPEPILWLGDRQFGVSKERVRQLETRAMRKLRGDFQTEVQRLLGA